MKALRLFGPGDIRLCDVPTPVPRAGELILRVKAASICGTDVRMWQNGARGASLEHPLTLGHEFAGVIEAVGEGVDGYRSGMRVAVQPNSGCGRCACCQQGYRHLCRDYEAFGVTCDGAFSPFVCIPARSVTAGNPVLLPDGVSFEEGALAEPLSCVYNGFEKLSVRAGETALVAGAGPIGIGHAMLLRLSGAKVILSDLEPRRLRAAKELIPGLICACGSAQETVMEHTRGLGADVAVIACPSPQAQAEALSLMNIHGRVCFFGGIPAGKEPVPLDTNLVHYRELMLTGSTRSSLGQFARVLRLIETGQLNAKGLITHVHPFGDICSAFEQAARAEGLKHIIRFDEGE